jgi:hypothetical protein
VHPNDLESYDGLSTQYLHTAATAVATMRNWQEHPVNFRNNELFNVISLTVYQIFMKLDNSER